MLSASGVRSVFVMCTVMSSLMKNELYHFIPLAQTRYVYKLFRSISSDLLLSSNLIHMKCQPSMLGEQEKYYKMSSSAIDGE